MGGIIEATFSTSGLQNTSTCVYVIVATNGDNKGFYVGRTGTSNGTGTSSPFKRLACHLALRGSTQSVFWNTDGKLKAKWFAGAEIKFFAIEVPREQVIAAEDWLIARFNGLPLLNSEPCTNVPEIPQDLEAVLESLFLKAGDC